MAGTRMEIELSRELFDELSETAQALGIADPAQAAAMAVTEWLSRRRAELDERDPSARYFVNQALDELIEKRDARK